MPIAAVNDVEIFYEAAGDPSDPCLLLIAGFNQQLTDWPEGLCDGLLDAGFYVVRFDNRDAGLSTHFEGSGLAYSLDDLATDTLSLLEFLNIDTTHILGVSMGGMVAQLVAIRQPYRVRSLTLLSTNTGNPEVGQPSDEIRANPSVRVEGGDTIENGYATSSRWASFDLGMTEQVLRDRLARRVERSHDSTASQRQLAAIVGANDRTDVLRSLNIPTVVVHGTDDPLVNVSGGRALAESIPNAELVLIEKLRHDIPEAIWPQLISSIKR